MPTTLTQFAITDVAPGHLRVTFRNPPSTSRTRSTIELQELVGTT